MATIKQKLTTNRAISTQVRSDANHPSHHLPYFGVLASVVTPEIETEGKTASLVVQWLGLCPAMQGTPVQSHIPWSS